MRPPAIGQFVFAVKDSRLEPRPVASPQAPKPRGRSASSLGSPRGGCSASRPGSRRPQLSMQESHRRGQSPLVVPDNIDAETPRCDLPDSIHDAKRQRIRERIRFRSSALPGAARPGPAAPPASPVTRHHPRGGGQPNTPSDASRMPRRQTSSSSWACTGHTGCGTKDRQEINTRVKQAAHERAEWESATSAKAAGHWRCGALLDTKCSNRPVLSNAPFATARKRSFPPQVPLQDSLFERSQRLGPISEHIFGVNNERIGVSR